MAASVDVDIQVNFSVSAVLPAAGSGTRMGLNTPKQFCRVLGKPLISYTIEAFERVSWIKEVIVVISKDKLVYMEDIIEEFKHNKVRIVEGGTTRHRSICNGIKGLVCDGRNPPEVVIIHDGARPLVQETLLRDVAMAAKHHGCTEYDFEHGTECLHLALTYSQTRAKLINGPSSLWKVTHQKDLYAFEAILKDNTSRKIIFLGKNNSSIQDTIEKKLCMRNIEIIYVDSQCSPWQRETASFISSTVCNIINHDIHDADSYNLSCEAFREMSKSNPTCQQVLLTVSLAKDPEKVTRLKKLTQDLHCRVSRTCIICIGIFVLLPGLGQLEPSQCDELAELVLDTCLNAKLIYSGQVFELDFS
ncbi:D-ribitol-5-phosphate cytidylyltransferase isoform X2 [Nematostella vectensis]|uniref:D-ribitol-5-phosphate cytidylyltransferase isoform X2 n=1 Tax=Nematostella vectensis TaxID=45351 RepID=UPI00207713E1|nr:D-ribitol-5-phosphate cytidylyltransferase isoform X2 [Nematostella vectensis]